MVPVKNSNLSANEDILKDGDTGGDIFDAARSGNIATVKGFLDLCVPVDLTDEDGWSPVHHAIAHGQVEVITLLMDRGCRMVPVKSRTEAFHYTDSEANIDTNIDPLKKDISRLKDDIRAKFLKAAQLGDTTAVTECLDLGVPVDLTDEDGWSPVHHAIAHGQVEVIRLLMDRGCRIDPVKNTSLSANGEILKDGDSGGDIFDAARSGNIATVKGFLDLCVPVDLTDEDGWSPVHHAIAHGQVEVITLLMDRGCRMVPVKNSNLSANEDILKDGDTGGDIFDAARSGNIATVKGFLDLCVPVDLTDEDRLVS
jgi:ankyrin repeat protein